MRKSIANVVKRGMDICMATVGLVLLAPLFALIALLIKFDSSGPVFFRQVRPGLHGKPFVLYKFRTMREAFGGEGNPLPDGERLTRLGRFLRSTSLDELPELYNVLKGEMSLVGPRPLLMEYLDRYTPEQARRHEVKPGITGWAQVHGAQRPFLGGEIPARRLVCGSPVSLARSQDPPAHTLEGPAAGGDKPLWLCHHAGI